MQGTKLQQASISGNRQPFDWFTGESLKDVVAKLLNDHPIHAHLAGELARRKKEFHSVDPDAPILLATGFGTTLILARDNPTCVYTFEASHPMWELMMHTVNREYFNGTLVLQRPTMPVTSAFGDVSFLHGNVDLSFGQMSFIPDALMHDFHAQPPYMRQGSDGTLVIAAADVNDLLHTLQDMKHHLFEELSAVREEIAQQLPPCAPVIMEFVPCRTVMVSCLARRSDRFVMSRGLKEGQ